MKAESARVHHHQAKLRLELHAHTNVCGLGLGLAQNGAGHAQVLGEEHVVLEAPHQVLAPPAKGVDAPPLQRCRELGRCERT